MLPSGAMSLNHALGFGVVTGILGSVLLAAQVNVLAAVS
jgi:heme O synthase-like polyprenyltransferase